MLYYANMRGKKLSFDYNPSEKKVNQKKSKIYSHFHFLFSFSRVCKYIILYAIIFLYHFHFQTLFFSYWENKKFPPRTHMHIHRQSHKKMMNYVAKKEENFFFRFSFEKMKSCSQLTNFLNWWKNLYNEKLKTHKNDIKCKTRDLLEDGLNFLVDFNDKIDILELLRGLRGTNPRKAKVRHQRWNIIN